MSYEIIYSKQFIKVNEHQVIPMLLQGSNNCYDTQTGRRARDWHNTFAHNPKGLIANNCDIIESLRAMQNNYVTNRPEYTDKDFGWFDGVALYGHRTRNTTFNMYFNVYKSGIKKAKTIEQLRAEGVTVKMYLSRYSHDTIIAEGKEIKQDVTFTSTEHMVSTINEWMAYYPNTNIYLTLYGLSK